jgi:hypothetical protein
MMIDLYDSLEKEKGPLFATKKKKILRMKEGLTPIV